MSAAPEGCDCPECLAGNDQWCCRLCHDLAAAERPPLCPRCKGGGVIDTSPPGVEYTAPWLQTDTDCPDCDGTGVLHPPRTMLDEWTDLGEAVNRLTEATREALEPLARRVDRFLTRVRERFTR